MPGLIYNYCGQDINFNVSNVDYKLPTGKSMDIFVDYSQYDGNNHHVKGYNNDNDIINDGISVLIDYNTYILYKSTPITADKSFNNSASADFTDMYVVKDNVAKKATYIDFPLSNCYISPTYDPKLLLSSFVGIKKDATSASTSTSSRWIWVIVFIIIATIVVIAVIVKRNYTQRD
jgi:hypothetical protein